MERSLAIAGVALLLISSIVGGTAFLTNNSTTEGVNNSSSAAQTVGASMSVENVAVINRSDGIITAEVTVKGSINEQKLKQALFEMYSDRRIEISTIRITNVSGNTAIVSLVTKGQANSTSVETQIENQLTDRAPSQRTETAANSSVSFNSSATFYQIDLVRGQPIGRVATSFRVHLRLP
jgi:hypothetical protein